MKAQPNKLKTGLMMSFLMTLILILYSLMLGRFCLTEGWAGYLFFWFWSSVKNFDFASLQHDIPNSLTGIIMGYFICMLARSGNTLLYNIVIVLTLLVVLFFSVTKLIPHVVGECTFLFFTVLTGNTMLAQGNYKDIAQSYIIGVVFFLLTLGITLIVPKKISEKKGKGK